MKICMYSPIFPPEIGGPATQSFNLCKALLSKGESPFVVTYGKNFSVSSRDGLKVYTYRRFYVWNPIDRIIRWLIFPFYIGYLLKKEKVDILHCHSVSMLSFMSALVAKLFGIPTVIKFAGDWVWETISTKEVVAKDFREIYTRSWYARLLTIIEKWGLNLFDVIWTPSQFRKENIEYLLGKNAPIVVIPNCLLLKDGGVKEKSLLDEVIIVSANRFIPHKRVPYLVEAYAKIATDNSRLILIGGGDPKELLKTREVITRYGLEDKVIMTGVLNSEEVYKWFSRASFYVSVSLEEGFPNVFIEALNYGLPIISTDIGGSRELVWDNETGFLVSVNDLESLTKKMNLLLKDSDLRNRFAKNSYSYSKEFNLDHRTGEFIDMYNRLLLRQ